MFRLNVTTRQSPPVSAIDQADEAVVSRVSALLALQPRVLLAIDGNCCAGKTTMANRLGERLHAPVFHMDDFFLRPEQRTPERLSLPGGNVDAERFLAEVLSPISRGEPVSYLRYDCKEDRLRAPVPIAPAAVCIVEGAYSLHPLLASHYDLKLFCRVDPALQKERVLRRNGKVMLSMFTDRWIPLENAYFEALQIEQGCDFVITSTQRQPQRTANSSQETGVISKS